jgi:hypothetical protein
MKTQIINKKHYQECDVVMLPTDKESKLCFVINTENSTLTLFEDPMEKGKRFFPQHLYILSNEDLKEGDWFIDLHNLDKPKFCDNQQLANKLNLKKEQVKKIISTTNKELTIIGRNISYPILGQTITYLPQIPQQFIDYFVSEYNKGNVISKVLVEVEEYDKGYSNKGTSSIPSSFSYWQGMGLKIKLNQNNEVNILTKQKQVFSREEVIALITKYNWDSDAANDAWKDKWLEQNL